MNKMDLEIDCNTARIKILTYMVDMCKENDNQLNEALKYLCGYRYELYTVLKRPATDWFTGDEAEHMFFNMFCYELKRKLPNWDDSKIEAEFNCNGIQWKGLQFIRHDLEVIAAMVADYVFDYRKRFENQMAFSS